MAILITSPGLVTTGTEGADDIRFITGANVTGNASTINGLGGNDTITNNGEWLPDLLPAPAIGAGAIFNAGGGADSVTLSSLAVQLALLTTQSSTRRCRS